MLRCAKVMDIQQTIMVDPIIMHRVSNDPRMQPTQDELPYQDVAFFRKLFDFLNSAAYYDLRRTRPTKLLSKLKALLENNFVLDKHDQAFGSGRYKHFLCAQLDEYELPWDLHEVDF